MANQVPEEMQSKGNRPASNTGWAGPDGITYATESDYTDSWGRLTAACGACTGQGDAARDGGNPVRELTRSQQTMVAELAVITAVRRRVDLLGQLADELTAAGRHQAAAGLRHIVNRVAELDQAVAA